MADDQIRKAQNRPAGRMPAQSKFIDLPGASCTDHLPDIQAFDKSNGAPVEPSLIDRTAKAMAAIKGGKKS